MQLERRRKETLATISLNARGRRRGGLLLPLGGKGVRVEKRGRVRSFVRLSVRSFVGGSRDAERPENESHCPLFIVFVSGGERERERRGEEERRAKEVRREKMIYRPFGGPFRAESEGESERGRRNNAARPGKQNMEGPTMISDCTRASHPTTPHLCG